MSKLSNNLPQTLHFLGGFKFIGLYQINHITKDNHWMKEVHNVGSCISMAQNNLTVTCLLNRLYSIREDVSHFKDYGINKFIK